MSSLLQDDPLLDLDAAPGSPEAAAEEPIRRGKPPMAVRPRKTVVYLGAAAAGLLSVALLMSAGGSEPVQDPAQIERAAADGSDSPVTPMPEQPMILDQMVAQVEEQESVDPVAILESAPDSVPQVPVGPGGREYAEVGRGAPGMASPQVDTLAAQADALGMEREQAYRRALTAAAVQETDAARALRQRLQAAAPPTAGAPRAGGEPREQEDPLETARREIEAAEQLLYPGGVPSPSAGPVRPLRPQPIPPTRPRSDP